MNTNSEDRICIKISDMISDRCIVSVIYLLQILLPHFMKFSMKFI